MYATIIEPHHHLVHETDSSKSFPQVGTDTWSYFINHNGEYKSNFADTIAPYMSCLINCLYWSPGDPKILSTENLVSLIGNEERSSSFSGVPFLPQKLTVIADISADLNGSLEFVEHCTSVEEPFEIVNPTTGSPNKDILSPGVLLTSIDYLPGMILTKIEEDCRDCPRLLRLSKIVETVQNCRDYPRLSRLSSF